MPDSRFTNWKESISDRGQGDVKLFNQWMHSIDLLRKTEADMLKILKEQDELIAIDEVVEFISKVVVTAKNQLLNIPSKMAPLLEGLEWPEIQDKLRLEIIEICERLSNTKIR